MTTFPSSLAGGRYLLVKQLGEGGMATVFRAFDQRLQVWRAIKILAAEYSEKPRLRQRFEAEAQTMALLEHKHIVRVYDVGTDGDTAYIVMEILEGGSLVDWLERHGPMPARLAVDVTIELSEGISAAHAKGVIHRDIKPHNVLVARDGTCRVTDFGIAQVSTNDASITRTGAVMGTWGYMAPEQRTNSKGVDERADVYSTAASLFTLLTNKMPMDLFASDRDDEMLDGVDPAIVPVLVKATEYKRENRYANMGQFCDALRAIRPQLPENPPETPPLAKDIGDPPEPPSPQDFRGTEPGVRRRMTGNTSVPSDENRTSGTIVADAGPAHAPTMAPDEGDTMDRDGPRIRDRALYGSPGGTPAPAPARSGVVRAGFVLGSAAAVGAIVTGVVLILVAGAMYLNKGPHDTVASAAPAKAPVVDTVAPPHVDTTPHADPVAQPHVDAPTALTPDTPPPVDPGKKPPKPKDDGKKPPVEPGKTPGTATTDPGPGTAVVPPPVPTVVVVTEPAKADQCVKVTPPPSASVGTDVIVKASLCSEDGSDVTLWYRPVGGEWQSRIMPKALGAHMTKLPIDAGYANGLEFYVESGSASKGSRGAPLSVPVR